MAKKESMKKKVLIFGPYKSGLDKPLPGGIARWIFDFLKSPLIKEFEFKVVDMSVIGDRSKKPNIFRKMIDESKRSKNIKRQTKILLKSESFDIAHYHCACGKFGVVRDYSILKKLRNKNIKLITHFHCNVNLHANANWLTKMYFKKLMRISSKVLVLNETSKQAVLSLWPNVSVDRIPNFISDEERLVSKKVINTSLDKIIFVGFVRRRKGIIELYEAAKSFPNITFRCIGQRDSELQQITPPSNVSLLNHADRTVIFEELDSSDIFLFPSHTEGFSIALLEAMSRGLPIITTDVGANKEMIDYDKGGIIVDVNSPNQIIEAINTLSDSSVREAFSNFNLMKVETSYTDTIVIQRILEIYKSINEI